MEKPCQQEPLSNPLISIDDAISAMFSPLGMQMLLEKYGDDTPAIEIQDAYTRAETWLCGGFAIAPTSEWVQ